MVFMEDSERAAQLALDNDVDAGLHLNFTSSFSGQKIQGRLLDHQHRLAHYLRQGRYAQVIYHPALANSFEYVTAAQIDEFFRLYGAKPGRIDGHHHMHLCANVLIAGLIPHGTIVRRNFTFQPGEKSITNRMYRKIIDSILAARHRVADYLYSLPPLEPPARIERIFQLAKNYVVEVETHPIDPAEYHFLNSGRMLSQLGEIQVSRSYKF